MLRLVPKVYRARPGLAVDLTRALFCGLPNRESRMAVFVSVADETADSGMFLYGGWSASVDAWEKFAAAWDERVLKGPPRIPYLHMTDIRDWNWQHEHGLTPWQADRRVDEAAEVLCSTGALIPVAFEAKVSDWKETLTQYFTPAAGRKKIRLDPDYIFFTWFAYTQLQWLYQEYGADVERVDFWVEENGKITRNMKGFHTSLMRKGLPYINREYLVPLVGEFHEVGKDRIPAQAADVLAWHARNAKRNTLDRAGWRRYWRMINGGFGTSRCRYGFRAEMSRAMMEEFAAAIAKYPRPGAHAR